MCDKLLLLVGWRHLLVHSSPTIMTFSIYITSSINFVDLKERKLLWAADAGADVSRTLQTYCIISSICIVLLMLPGD